jgi:hypothetical protein
MLYPILDPDQQRYINRLSTTSTLEYLLEQETRSATSTSPFLCCKDNSIVPFNHIWHLLAAEFCVRKKQAQTKERIRLQLPTWLRKREEV